MYLLQVIGHNDETIIKVSQHIIARKQKTVGHSLLKVGEQVSLTFGRNKMFWLQKRLLILLTILWMALFWG